MRIFLLFKGDRMRIMCPVCKGYKVGDSQVKAMAILKSRESSLAGVPSNKEAVPPPPSKTHTSRGQSLSGGGGGECRCVWCLGGGGGEGAGAGG